MSDTIVEFEMKKGKTCDWLALEQIYGSDDEIDISIPAGNDEEEGLSVDDNLVSDIVHDNMEEIDLGDNCDMVEEREKGEELLGEELSGGKEENYQEVGRKERRNRRGIY